MSSLRWIGALALLAGTSAATAQSLRATIALPCVSQPEAEALVAAVAPELITEMGRICANSLPPGALLRQTSGPLIDRYRAASDLAWPQGRGAIAKIVGPDVGALLGSDLARPLLSTLVAPALTKTIEPADCPALDRILTLAQPLPPRNMAGLFVSILQLVDAKRIKKGGKATLPICAGESKAGLAGR